MIYKERITYVKLRAMSPARRRERSGTHIVIYNKSSSANSPSRPARDATRCVGYSGAKTQKHTVCVAQRESAC